jgi:Na+/H+-dicarboxylate symporters
MNSSEKSSCCAPQGKRSGLYLSIAIALGILLGLWGHPMVITTSEIISKVFVNFLKLVSLPIVFLSIVSTASGMEGIHQIKQLGKRVLFYTILTTMIAATVAMILFMIIQPVHMHNAVAVATESAPTGMNYVEYLIQIIPSNIIQPFYENHVIGVLFLAVVFSFAILTIPSEGRKTLHSVFHSLYQAVMKLCGVLIDVIPVAIFAFIVLFVRDLNEGLEVQSLAWYLLCVLLANLIQAFIVLPIILKWRNVSPVQLFKAMYPALSAAFFTKSSAAALPIAIKVAQERANISERVANFSLPLCTTINMNACAAFIYITVLFVSMSQGVTYTFVEMCIWIFLATLAAIGNAGVPMGCFFLSSAILASMNVPLYIMGVILPFYSLIDMLESAINVWSDACVTACVQNDTSRSEALATAKHEVVRS